MNFSQRLGLLILIVISLVYIYTSFGNKNINLPEFGKNKENVSYNPVLPSEDDTVNDKEDDKSPRTIKIYVIDKTATIRPVNRTCDPNIEKS